MTDWNLKALVFMESGKPGNSEKNPPRQEPTTNSIHLWHQDEIETRPNWLEVGTLTTAPTLAWILDIDQVCSVQLYACAV